MDNTRDYLVRIGKSDYLIRVSPLGQLLYIDRMNLIKTTDQWLNPAVHLVGATAISIITALIAFRSTEFDRQTLITFYAFYLILISMTFLFIYRSKLINPKTRQLLQFSFFLLGFVLMMTGVMGMLNGSLSVISVFLLMLFLPGIATLRAGLHFKKDEE